VTGRYLTDLADVCRDAGLVVNEVDNWQTAARNSGGYAEGRPWCVMWHHTASNTTPANDVAYIVGGSDDAPLANLYLARDGSVTVCAAGCTNTNGSGGPVTMSKGTVPQDSMNTYAIGIEAANDGRGQTWPPAQIDAYFALSDALANAYGLDPADVCTHAEWAPTRKIDPATAAAVEGWWQPGSINSSGTWSVVDVRAECVERAGIPTPTPPEDDMRAGPYLIQATGADGTPPGRVYATDGNAMTLRWLDSTEALDGYRWQAVNVFGWSAPELAAGADIPRCDTLAAFGVIIG
jgi:N-acetylmuramoyl-L-alanine amidase